MITTLLAWITPPCKDVTRLASEAVDRPLPWVARLNLQLHYWICEACARYRDRLKTIRHILRRSPNQDHRNERSLRSSATQARLTEASRAKHG
ncbi:MAG: zf-HC2 domain-containing protein [Nitrospirota bacterium]|nr:zf-HC2 domain-containing protein [Nitrospirota bacterium]